MLESKKEEKKKLHAFLTTFPAFQTIAPGGHDNTLNLTVWRTGGREHDHFHGILPAAKPRGPAQIRVCVPVPALEATQRQINGFSSQLPYKYHLEEAESVGD